MDEYAEKLIVALMVMIQEKGGEYRLDTNVYQQMFDLRHNKGIQVRELGNHMVLKLGDMTVRPDEAEMN